MITGREYITGPALAGTVVASVVLLAAAVTWQVQPPARLITAEPIVSLQNELDALQPYSAAELQRKKQREQELHGMIWTDARYAAWLQALKAEWDKKKFVWKLQDVFQEEGAFAVTHRYVLTLDKVVADDWPAIYMFLTKTDAESGTILHGLTFSIPRDSRHFEQIQVIFSIPFQKKK